MFIKRLKDCPEFAGGDNSSLREPVHAEKGDFKLEYSLAHAVVEPGTRTVPHRLRVSEVYYIIEGAGRMHIDDEEADVGPDDTVYIPPHATQYIENTGAVKLRFLCIVEPAWRPEYEEVI